MKFWIRADGNSTIGMGHIMRCLSIAKAICKYDVKCVFVLADSGLQDFISHQGFSTFILQTDYTNMDMELSFILPLIEQNKPLGIIVDSYYVTSNYLVTLREKTNITYIDDCAEHVYPVDTLINYSINAQTVNYQNKYIKTNTALLLGCSYTPLRDMFTHLPSFEVNTSVKRILILAGGADSLNISETILRYLLAQPSYDNVQFLAVQGALSANFASITSLASLYLNRVFVLHDVEDMASLMRSCDIALSAGGSTLYELCACGVPTISFSYVDNQLPNVTSFAQQDIIDYAGDFREKPDIVLENLCSHLTTLSSNFALRQKKSNTMQCLVSGDGSNEIAKKLIKLFSIYNPE